MLISIFDSGCMFVTMQELLTFVAVRLFLPKGSSRLPRAVANALYQIIAMVAQQFEGYIFTVNIDEVWSCGACDSYLRTDQSFAAFRTDQSFSVFLTVRDRASHNLSVLYSDTLCPKVSGWNFSWYTVCTKTLACSCVHGLANSACCTA